MNEKRIFLSLAIILGTILFLGGCKKSHRPDDMPALDWDNRPACAFAMPAPVGQWAKDTINVYCDFSQVYARDGLKVPAHVLPLASHGIRNQLEAWRAKHGDLLPATRLVETQAEADVVIFIYYEPYKKGASGAIELAESDVFPLTPEQAQAKTTSGIAHELPPPEKNYNACVWPVVKRGVILAAACAFNGAATDHYATTGDPQGNSDQFYLAVGNHETGHWQLGFDDDLYGTVASLMCYRAMTQWPTPCDLQVSGYCTIWMRKTTRRTRSADNGLDCGGDG